MTATEKATATAAAVLLTLLAGCQYVTTASLLSLAETAVDGYTTVVIANATPEELQEFRAKLKVIEPYTTRIAKKVTEKIALIDARLPPAE